MISVKSAPIEDEELYIVKQKDNENAIVHPVAGSPGFEIRVYLYAAPFHRPGFKSRMVSILWALKQHYENA